MLTLRSQPPPTRFPDRKMYQRRGRSRQVSHAALARQASEERRNRSVVPLPTKRDQATERPSPHNVHVEPFNKQARIAKDTLVPIKTPPTPLSPSTSSSPGSMSSDYFESPPVPPRSLEDQVHIAYALDDIHLARVLLLKLKGIEVTSDDDPRIAAVRDEDFDSCFFPHGKLMDEADEKALFEQQRKEMEKVEEKRREDRLRACERIWEQEKERLREARELALRRKEADERRQAEEEKRIKLVKEKIAKETEAAERRARLNRTRSSLAIRNVVSYEMLGKLRTRSSHASTSSRVDDHEPFVYPFMTRTTKQSKSSQSLSQSPSQPFQPFTRPTYDESRTVPFRDVLASIQGPLFPVERRTTSPSYSSSQSTCKDRRKHQETELLESLLRVVKWEVDERRKLKGKWTERPIPRKSRGDNSILSCAACSISSSSMSSSLQSSSRRSWLSFSSASSSTSTAITTPSTSPPRSSWFSKPVPSSSPGSATRKQRPTSMIIFNLPVPPHSCQPHSRFTPVPLAECPLTLKEPSSTPAAISFKPFSIPEKPVLPSSDRVLRRVSQLVEFAKEFQNTYVNATLFATMASSDAYEVRTVNHVSVASFPGDQSGRHRLAQPNWKPNRAGYRAHATDVAIFLNAESNRGRSQEQTIYAPSIPLQLWLPSPNTPRTILPDPLPYPLRFKPIPKPCRSPFSLHANLVIPRHRNSPSPESSDSHLGAGVLSNGTLSWRMRTVENPMYLRLKALQNVLWEEGVNWQGRTREGNMGAGREKVTKVTFEGVGRSWLSGGAEDGYW